MYGLGSDPLMAHQKNTETHTTNLSVQWGSQAFQIQVVCSYLFFEIPQFSAQNSREMVYPPGNQHTPPWKKEHHRQKHALGGDMFVPRSR